MNIIEYCAFKFESDPAFIFFCAHDYNEIRLGDKGIASRFLAYDTSEEKKLPDFVKDYCCEVLNGTIKLPFWEGGGSDKKAKP